MALTRILWLTPENREGGIRKYGESLFPAVKRLATQSGQVRTDGVEFDILEMLTDPASTQAEAAALIEKARGFSPHLIHIQHEYGLFGSKAPGRYTFPEFARGLREALPGARLVATAHNVLASDYSFPLARAGWQWPARWILNQFFIEKLRRSWSQETWGVLDGVMVHSRHQAETVKSSGVRRVEVIPHFVPKTEGHADFKRDSGHVLLPHRVDEVFREDRKTVLVFGFFSPDKGQDIVISAVPYMRENIHVILAGGARRTADYTYMESCLDLTRRLGIQNRVSVTGFVSDRHIDELYQRADLVVAPFRETTGSGSITQGLARGASILASDLPINRELDERVTGCLEFFKSEHSQDLAKRVEELLLRPERLAALKAHALEYAIAHSPEKMAALHLNWYADLMKERVAGRRGAEGSVVAKRVDASPDLG